MLEVVFALPMGSTARMGCVGCIQAHRIISLAGDPAPPLPRLVGAQLQ